MRILFLGEKELNSRAKDLIDMLLLKKLRPIDTTHFKDTVQRVFGARSTHVLPKSLDVPPHNWNPLFERLASECGLTLTMEQAHRELKEFFQMLLS